MPGWHKIAWAAVLLAGCQSTKKVPYSDNPLLLSREPLSQPAAPIKPPDVAKSKTASPASSARQSFSDSAKQGPVLPTVTPAPVAPVRPAVQQVSAVTPPPAPAPATPPLPVFVPAPAPALPPVPVVKPASESVINSGTYGHDSNYSWVQGEIDLHYRGHKELRFCPVSEDDPIGGKVRLVDDPRLADLKMGDIVRIEGELVRDDPTAVGGQACRFHVKDIRIIQKAGSRTP
ncbi:MAG: OB-fold nucleic acid binding domain-containing protein [Gemmataceae bacterium]|nr:OB-fold nucleic acid binding domain-containing protein [Gemmataceae bacterium]